MNIIDKLKNKMWGDDSFHLLRDVILDQNRQIEELKKKVSSLEEMHDDNNDEGYYDGDFYKY